MKKTLALIPLLVLVAGCNTLDKTVMEKKPVAVVQPTTVTNYTSTGTPIIETKTVTNIVYVPTGNVTPGVQQVTGLLTDLGTIGVPWAGVAGGVLGWLATLYVGIRRGRVNVALIQGIEASRKILRETPEGQVLDAKIKALLQEHQDVAGVLNEVNKLVNQYTSKTT